MSTCRPVWSLENNKVIETEYYFDWVSGMSEVSRKGSMRNLHQSISKYTGAKALEVSSASNVELGRALSAFNLRLDNVPLECIFQSSKVYQYGGPYLDLLKVSSAKAKKDERHKSSGKLVGFRYNEQFWFLEPKTAFYDYIYVKSALSCLPIEELKKLADYEYFTDIMFNPMKSINCQARAVVILKYIVLNNRMDVLKDKATWIKFHKEILGVDK